MPKTVRAKKKGRKKKPNLLALNRAEIEKGFRKVYDLSKVRNVCFQAST